MFGSEDSYAQKIRISAGTVPLTKGFGGYFAVKAFPHFKYLMIITIPTTAELFCLGAHTSLKN